MERKKGRKNKIKMSKKIPKLGRCYACNKTFFIENMRPIILIQSEEEGSVEIKRYLCDECSKKLDRYKFIEEGKKERKKNLKRVVKEIREKEKED